MGKVYYTEEFWVDNNINLPVSYRTEVYITEMFKAKHLWDGTECDHGLDGVPLEQWVTVDWPLHCKAQFMIIPIMSDTPFYIDSIPTESWPG